MEKRNLDGIYFRVKRDYKWDDVCFSDLTDEEREEVMNNKNVEWYKSMCRILANTIRNIGEQFDIVAD